MIIHPSRLFFFMFFTSSSLALAFSTVITNSSGAALNRSRMSEIVSVRDVVDDDPRDVNDVDG